MTISDIISKHYEELHDCCRIRDKAIAQGKTEEDILNDVCITAIQKYKGRNIEEEDGLSYLKKTLFMELHFQWHRVDNKIIYTDNIEKFDTI